MATINYLYRSNKPEAFLIIRLLFRYEDQDFQIGGKTKIEVSKDYWTHKHRRTKFGNSLEDEEIKDEIDEVKDKMKPIDKHIFNAFNNTDPEKVNKEWLKDKLKEYYNPPEKMPEIPKDLIGFINYYLELKKAEIKLSKYKRLTTTKNKMIRLEKELGYKILIAEINEDFKTEYVKFSNKHSYAKNTQQRELVRIKTICNYAKYLGLNTHSQLDKLNLKRDEVNHVFLNFDELEIIKKEIFTKDYLDNARNWLLISCYTGQRVSDFMKFTKGTIRDENGKQLLEFRQQKTSKLMTIPLSKEVRNVLSKSNGNFPRPISDQKYNDYIKEVCAQCGFDEITKGKKRICIAPENVKATRYDYRDVDGEFPKWELVSSHIGRRSFATNYYGKVPTTYLIGITGHSTEKQFLNYIKKSNKDLALDAYDYFN
jgi:hypothetical protein